MSCNGPTNRQFSGLAALHPTHQVVQLLSACDIFSPNEAEAESLVGPGGSQPRRCKGGGHVVCRAPDSVLANDMNN